MDGRRHPNRPASEALRARYFAPDFPSIARLATEYGVTRCNLRRWLKEAGIEPRSQREQLECDVATGRQDEYYRRGRPSPAALRERYLSPEAPSVKTLATFYGTTRETVKQWLLAAGITPRSISEQCKCDFQTGRKTPPTITPELRERMMVTRHARPRHGLPLPASMQAGGPSRKRAAWHKRRPLTKPCSWCGEPVTRTQRKVPHYGCKEVACDRSHAARIGNHRRLRPGEPRPVIREKLAALCVKGPFTWEAIERLGAPLGAEEPEILAVLEMKSQAS